MGVKLLVLELESAEVSGLKTDIWEINAESFNEELTVSLLRNFITQLSIGYSSSPVFYFNYI